MLESNVALEIFAAIILCLILFSCCLESKKNRSSVCFIGMLSSNCMALITEGISMSLKGRLGMESLDVAVSLIALISGFSLCCFYVNYVYACISQQQRISKRWLRVADIGLILSVCYTSIGVYSGWFFKIENGEGYLTEYLVFAMLYDVFGVALAMIMLLKHRKVLPAKDFIALLMLPMMAIIAIINQCFIAGEQTQMFVFTMLSCVIIYLMIQRDRSRRTAVQEQRMEEMYTQLMLSQIQPHFIFNALSGIRRLIQKDQKVAVEAVEQFSLYLRTNLDSLNSSRLVPFQRELEHAKEYLYLEKLRFRDRLRVEYDICCDSFCLPVLTLQPIVENAVRHGVLAHEEGGTVRILTEEDAENYIICVEDDGVGFDPDAELADGKTHVGIVNVRQRLKVQCCGMLMIFSKPGCGTRAEIRLPKNSNSGGVV